MLQALEHARQPLRPGLEAGSARKWQRLAVTIPEVDMLQGAC